MAAKLRKSILPHAVLILFSFLFLFPFLWLVMTSLKTPDEIFQLPPNLLPDTFQWSNYAAALETIPFARYMTNTLIICAVNIAGQLFAAPLVAYSISRIPWKGRGIIFSIVVATMILPAQVQLIPQYIIFTKLGWVNTIFPLTIGAFFGAPFFIFLLRQFLMGIPTELSEAAKIDGASEIRIYIRIILPILKPALVTVALFSFVWSYVDFMGPLIYLNDSAKWTITLGLQGFQQDHGAQWEKLMAASTIMTLPMIVLYFFGQKYFMQSGSALTGFK
ncbi:binding-protein-dependent transport systems inner membrane component [Paenibacillus alvei TS-15]|uniref:Binding-protein-dependent transport systems inner membrane component n=1 Tax=Paenibacillus alvei TS-15 TaxID=1117108 RepID=S9SMG2_PAEAL|nr:carbohydrate ABC transporter permease [Paenibacillus alvei]EPY05884.1 binding-protein-dependent transport systems inner membrane component [Paenibacillus alvei TS-15]